MVLGVLLHRKGLQGGVPGQVHPFLRDDAEKHQFDNPSSGAPTVSGSVAASSPSGRSP